jgi:hypothetical protein
MRIAMTPEPEAPPLPDSSYEEIAAALEEFARQQEAEAS